MYQENRLRVKREVLASSGLKNVTISDLGLGGISSILQAAQAFCSPKKDFRAIQVR